MKKLFTILIIILVFGLTSAFAQEMEYTGFVKSVVKPEGIAIINELIYEVGDIISGTSYMLVKIEYNFVVLKDTKDGSTLLVRFKYSGKPKVPTSDT
jgi:hypothetical protein